MSAPARTARKPPSRKPPSRTLRLLADEYHGSRLMRVGVGLVAAMAGLALLGPLLSPHDPLPDDAYARDDDEPDADDPAGDLIAAGTATDARETA